MGLSVGTAIGYLELDTSKFQSGFEIAKKQLQGFTDTTASAQDRFTSLGNGLKTIGSNMSKYVTLPLAGVGTTSVMVAADFEKSMDNVAALSGATGKDLEALTNIAKEMGSTTQFSASESADALGYMALAGWDTQESISALPGVLDLAASSGMGLADASDMVTDYLSAFGEEADQAGRMADVLAKAQASSNTTAQQLGEAFKNCAVNANSFGLDIEQTTAVLGKLADQGLKGSEAGTALNAVFRDMSSKMEDGAIKIGDANVKITDSQGNFRSLADIVTDVNKATDGLSESEKMVALQSTFTADSIKAMGILMNTGGDSINDFTNDLYGAEGAASEMASAMNDNLSGQLTQLKSALEGAAISIGEALMPMIKVLVEWLNNLVTWFNNLSPGMQTTIVAFGAVLAAIGPVILIVGQLCIAIGGLVGFFSAGGLGATVLGGAIALLSGPVGIVIGVITALIAVGVLLYQNWDTIKAKCTEIWQNYIQPTIENVTSAISSFITATWEGIKGFLSTCWELISSLAKTVWEGIKSTISNVINTIKTTITTVWNAIKTTITTVVNAIKTVISTVFEAIKTLITTVVNGWKNIITTAWNAIQTVIQTVVNAIQSVISSVFNAIKGIIDASSNGWKATLTAVWEGIKSVVTTAVNAVKTVISTVFNAIKTAISTVVNGWKNIITTAWNGIKTTVSNAVNNVKSTISNVWSGLQSLLVAPFNAAKGVIDGILSGISSAISGVKNAISSVKSAASNVIDKINPFRSITIPQDDVQTYNLYRDISQAQRLVYSNELAKTSIAESIKNVTSSARNMTGANSNKNKEYSSKNITINNTYNSPKPASIRELKKQDEIQMRRLAMQF